MSKNTSIEEKITLLLRKAESTDSEHERDALSAAAEKLMIKFGIEMAQLDMNPKHKDSDPIETTKIVVRGIYARQLGEIIEKSAHGLGARAFSNDMRKWNGTIVITILDYKSTIGYTRKLAESLTRQGERAMRFWWKTARSWTPQNEGYIARRSFLAGFGSGAYNRILDEREEALATNQGAGELVHARESKLDDTMFNDFGVKIRKASAQEKRDRMANEAGFVNGMEADLAVAAGDLSR